MPAGLGCVAPHPGDTGTSVGNTVVALRLRDAVPSVPAAILFGATRAEVAVFGGGCSLLVGPQTFAAAVSTDPAGRARLPLPIPATPAIQGTTFTAQAAVLDPGGPPQRPAALTDGLRVLVGR